MAIGKKFLFTQISAPIVGLGSMVFVAYIIGRFSLLNAEFASVRSWIFFILLLLSLPISMYLWGRALVLMGILTKDEARGYPFSKPWERKK